jgi:hypothetical protein
VFSSEPYPKYTTVRSAFGFFSKSLTVTISIVGHLTLQGRAPEVVLQCLSLNIACVCVTADKIKYNLHISLKLSWIKD